MELATLWMAQSQLVITGLRLSPEGVTILATPKTGSACCPTCGQPSHRIHSHYDRHLQDLPAHGRAVGVELELRRFFCDRSDCPRLTFSESLEEMAQRHARKTSRLVEGLQDIVMTSGAEAGSRLAGQLQMPASPDTLLRLIRRLHVPVCSAAPRVLGVDEWAWHKGQRYGTILCDLEKHRPVELLPERSSAAFAAWLMEHPGAQIISRDRGGDYAKGASEGAPDAVQVADRWHLLHNLTDALRQGIDQRQSLLAQVAQDAAAAALAPAPAASPVPEPTLLRRRLSIAEQKRHDSLQRRLDRYQRVRQLLDQGMGLRQIARILGLSRQTVKRFARAPQFPEHATPLRRRPTLLDHYLPLLRQQWEAGCDNVPRLWQALKAQGFTGSIHMVRRQVRAWRRVAGRRSAHGPQPTSTTARVTRPSARRIAWLALGHIRKPTAQDEAMLQAVYQHWPQLQETAELCRQFASVLKGHDPGSLEAWVQLAGEPQILPAVRRFAEVLREDWDAVVQAASLPWSQGQVEGQVNRLKLIKRQMYGRANFDLLRQRVLQGKRA